MRLYPSSAEHDAAEQLFERVFTKNSDFIAGVEHRHDDWAVHILYPSKYLLSLQEWQSLARILSPHGDTSFYFIELEGDSEERYVGYFSFDDYMGYETEIPPHAKNCLISDGGRIGISFSDIGCSVVGGPIDIVKLFEMSLPEPWDEQEEQFVDYASDCFVSQRNDVAPQIVHLVSRVQRLSYPEAFRLLTHRSTHHG